MSDEKRPKEICVYCERERSCPFNVFFGKAVYPCCRLCIVEAKKDGFVWSRRK